MAKKAKGKNSGRTTNAKPKLMALPKAPGAITRKVSVVETGGVRRASISIDANGVPLKPIAGGFSGSVDATLDPPDIVAVWSAKGVKDDSFDFEVTINGKTQPIKGFLEKDGLTTKTQTWKFEDFGLEAGKQ